jgi:hypothetical protein
LEGVDEEPPHCLEKRPPEQEAEATVAIATRELH